MAQKPKIPAGEDGLRKDATQQSDAPGQERRKETFPKEALEGEPGYGEPPPEVRKDKLPDQGW